MLVSFLSGEFLLHTPCWLLLLSPQILLHIPCWLCSYLGSFSYPSRAAFIFMWGLSLKHPVLPYFLCWEFLLHIPCCLDIDARSFSSGIFFFFFFYTSRAALFMLGVSLHIPWILMQGVFHRGFFFFFFFTHPMGIFIFIFI